MRLIAQIRARGSVTNRVGGLLGRFAVTAIAVGIAAIIGWQLWIYYLEAPWTRDGRVRADVVQLAADVSGLVSDVLVHDNQVVKKGDVLFRIDPARFQIALRDAQANVDSKLAASQEAERETARYNRLNALSVSEEPAARSRRHGGYGSLSAGSRQPRCCRSQPGTVPGARTGQRLRDQF
jgi:multidrug resistance efflux pump